jgi:hypothetical protein
MRTLAIIAGLGAVAMAVAPIKTAVAQRDTEKFEWRGRVDAGKTLEIRNVNGAVHASPASGREVVVTALKSGRRSDPASVKIEVVPHDGGVTICAIYPSRNADRPNECRPGGGGRNSTDNNDVEVEFTVQVPAGVEFTGATVNGDVQARDIGSDVRATTVNGDIDVTAAGLVEGETVNGSVHVEMGRADWTGTMRFKTVNGGITVQIPAGLSAVLDASTVNGDIETDFPVTVQGRFGHRRLHGTIGDGGRELRLETVNGGIEIRKG